MGVTHGGLRIIGEPQGLELSCQTSLPVLAVRHPPRTDCSKAIPAQGVASGPSFRSQRFDRIDQRRPVGWEVGGEQRNNYENRPDNGKDHRIPRLNLE